MNYGNSNPIQNLIKKEMSRKDFLVYLGLISLSLSGIPSLLKMFTQSIPENQDKKEIPGFGKGSYGA